jgi:HAD superfamily hydrolase (TIGR01509 family)
MEWVDRFQLFLFDFDGLLVDNEKLHLEAYVLMCKSHGCELTWDLPYFFGIAHLSSNGLKEAIYREFPELYAKQPKWEILYEQKKEIYLSLVRSGRLELMPGVEKLLKVLESKNIRRCVATNSPKEHIEMIKSSLPALGSIPLWVTREDYARSKPEPDAYLKAIEMLGQPQDRTIGFEDSFKGYTALKKARCSVPVMICPSFHPQLENFPKDEEWYFETFEAIPKSFQG